MSASIVSFFATSFFGPQEELFLSLIRLGNNPPNGHVMSCFVMLAVLMSCQHDDDFLAFLTIPLLHILTVDFVFPPFPPTRNVDHELVHDSCSFFFL